MAMEALTFVADRAEKFSEDHRGDADGAQKWDAYGQLMSRTLDRTVTQVLIKKCEDRRPPRKNRKNNKHRKKKDGELLLGFLDFSLLSWTKF